ncbi:efflux RND transporter permease subunit [Granulicella rosea]|nr:efflux RND transporter permease subunit [Granulicella rosea]
MQDHGVNFSRPFIERPVATTLLSLAILLAGTLAYVLLPVASLPQVEYPTISVSAALPGADPETMASAVATPLERQFGRIAGINQMTSSSAQGFASISMQFDLSRPIDGAARDVQAAINAARSQLPANMPSNPTYRKVNPADSPILIIGLQSDTMTPAQLYDLADSVLAQKFAQIDGVGQVSTGGSSKPSVRIEANPMQLSSYGLGLEAVRAAIGTVNVNQPKGYLVQGDRRYTVNASDQLFGAAAYAPLIVATNRGPVNSAAAASGLPASVASSATATATSSTTTPAANSMGIVRLRDIAKVTDSVEDVHTFGTINGKPGIIIILSKTAAANIIATVDRVLETLPRLQASIPPQAHLVVCLDRTESIRASVADVTRTMLISIVLVIGVVFLFLREVRSTLIPSVSVPLSLLGTLGVMYLLGYTLDNLSLMALTISTGFVVDDAIVVVENISRHLEEGMSPHQAALQGSREIGFTVLSMSISLIAVFIPILMMGGLIGRIFREFAITLSIAIFVSLVVSLTTTPMLSAKFLAAHGEKEHSAFYKVGERFLNWVTRGYGTALRWVLRFQPLVLGVTFATVLLSVYLFVIVPKGFFPIQDTGKQGAQLIGQQDVSFEAIKAKSMEVVAMVHKDPGIENVMSVYGGGGGYGGSAATNNVRIFMGLKPYEQRHKIGDTGVVVTDRLRKKTAGMPGARFFMDGPTTQDINVGGRAAAAQYQYSLTAESLNDLYEWAPRLMAEMEKIPILKDVNTDQVDQGLREVVVIDRDTASRLGVSPLTIDNTLYDAFGQRQVSTTYVPLNQYHVVMEMAPEQQTDLDALKQIYVKSTSGAMVPLSTFAHFEERRVPLAVNHQSQMPATTLSFNLAPGASLSQATEAVENARIRIGMPSTVHGGFQGTAAVFQDSLKSEPMLIGMALAAVYIVLGILYESLVHPLTILSTLPSAGIGAIAALMLFHIDLTLIAMIGIILLIGIVKKNAIMMIDFALIEEREHGLSPRDAIYQACIMRFRPIMMTTLAAMIGGVPLALGGGSGSELRQPLGITIVGGLIVSQCLTLFTTPVVYLFFDRLGRIYRTKTQQAEMRGLYLPHESVAGDF